MIKKSWRALFLRKGIKIKRAIVRNFLVQYKLDTKIRDGRDPRDHLIPCCHFIDWETDPRDGDWVPNLPHPCTEPPPFVLRPP